MYKKRKSMLTPKDNNAIVKVHIIIRKEIKNE